jgi:hypothetical protein
MSTGFAVDIETPDVVVESLDIIDVAVESPDIIDVVVESLAHPVLQVY